MSIRSDHKALMFVGAIAVLGVGVRAVRASASSDVANAQQPALQHQMQAADSASKAGKNSKFRGGGRKAAVARDTTVHSPAPLGDRRGYIDGRLDLDVATAAQIDSLPGVSATMAKRIAADRMQRGPFLNLERLRRVSGAGPAFIRRIDSLVTFSGVVKMPSAEDTIVPVRRKR